MDVIIVAAGLGTRLGRERPKALVVVGGRPLLAWSVDVFGAHPATRRVILLAPADHVAEVMAAVPPTDCDVAVVPGGESRAASVALGLAEVDVDAEIVAVHDAARPLVSPGIIDAVLAGLDGFDGAIAAAPLADTLKRVDSDGAIEETPSRASLWRAETPQIFRRPVLAEAIDAAISAGRLDAATDCASLVEANRGRVTVVGHGTPNMKVTTESDIPLAEVLLARVR
ncbi:MAG: 2-C-methyl-D-erythritol 4-phosphate cytidylyltransferase [Thermoleophilia bacterium]